MLKPLCGRCNHVNVCQALVPGSPGTTRHMRILVGNWNPGCGTPPSHIILEEDPSDLVITSVVFFAKNKNCQLRYLQKHSSKNRTIHLSQQKKDPSPINPKSKNHTEPPKKAPDTWTMKYCLGSITVMPMVKFSTTSPIQPKPTSTDLVVFFPHRMSNIVWKSNCQIVFTQIIGVTNFKINIWKRCQP